MEDKDQRAPRPPEAPSFDRKLMFDRAELIGVPLLLLLPVLALFGVFGVESDETTVSRPGFDMQIKYPKRTRYGQSGELEVLVRNTGVETLRPLIVAIDRHYLDHFNDIDFNLQPSKVTRHAYEVRIDALQPGESRFINVDLVGKHVGERSGRIEAVSGATAIAHTEISTFIFP